jgi:hypothetical protein
VELIGGALLSGPAAEMSDEHPAAGLRSVQGADEGLDVGAADMPVGIGLGPYVNRIQAQLLQADQPIKARVAGGAKMLGGASRPPYPILTSRRSTSNCLA